MWQSGNCDEYIIAENFYMDKYIFDENNGLWYERQGVTEQFKASEQMVWVGRMNNIWANASQTFHTPAGDVETDFTHQRDGQTYSGGDKFAAVSQSFKQGGSMWFLLPDEGGRRRCSRTGRPWTKPCQISVLRRRSRYVISDNFQACHTFLTEAH